MNKEEAIEMLHYFHFDKGDMERFCDYDRAIRMFPDIDRAFQDYKYYSKVLDNMVNLERDRVLYKGT